MIRALEVQNLSKLIQKRAANNGLLLWFLWFLQRYFHSFRKPSFEAVLRKPGLSLGKVWRPRRHEQWQWQRKCYPRYRSFVEVLIGLTLSPRISKSSKSPLPLHLVHLVPSRPTSVLAGILRLSLLECELGTLWGPKEVMALLGTCKGNDKGHPIVSCFIIRLHVLSCSRTNCSSSFKLDFCFRPIIFFVAACSLSGSFYLKQEESEAHLALAPSLLFSDSIFQPCSSGTA